MPATRSTLLAATLLAFPFLAQAAADTLAPVAPIKVDATRRPADNTPRPTHFTPDSAMSDGTVTVGGKKIDYTATAGVMVIQPRDYDDVPQDHKDEDGADKPAPTEATMSYVAYVKKGVRAETRPVTFVYNGGPGSSTVWLHMGAFGPRRVVTKDDTHTPAAPYQLVNNDQSLLDATDLVFVDAPGTGFGRLAGKDKEKEFWGVDQDAHAFGSFIQQYLSINARWNSPKYLFGESYGTTRSAVLSNMLANDWSIDLNGVILLSQIMNFDASPDGPESNPGTDIAYQVVLPTYAAVAWYHHKLPPETNPPTDPKDLPALLAKVQTFAMTDYALALAAGASLDATRRDQIATQLHNYTGLPVEYIKRANLRVNGGEFEKNLQADAGLTTGRLDSRFSGPDMDPLSKASDYDPQSNSISSAYVSTFNDYVRRVLHFGMDREYRAVTDAGSKWDLKHQQPGQDSAQEGPLNVMPDLAAAMKGNPLLKVQLNQGYYDLATPYYEGIYEMQHLPIPASLQGNIEIKQYFSGHMVYAHQDSLQQLHDNVAGFIGRTNNQSVQPAAQ